MPINLRYGQQAVARGFIDQKRLQQVLSKQKQLADQGKKVSVRMILEKSRLLDKSQLEEIDRDLNIKVVKKRTTKLVREAGRGPATGAQNFAGDKMPAFAGENIDRTVFSPPPPDMQERIRRERERAKAESAGRQVDDEEQAFLQGDDASPFGADPFADEAMAPEPAEAGLKPDDAPQELARTDSAPILESFATEHDTFTDDDLPFAEGFDEEPMETKPSAPHIPQAPARKPAPIAGIRSPEELDSGAPAAPPHRHEPAPWEREPAEEPAVEAEVAGVAPEPENETWGEIGVGAASGFGEEAMQPGLIDGIPEAQAHEPMMEEPAFEEVEAEPHAEETVKPAARGRRGADDFGDIELPTGKRMDDLPTAPSRGDDVHPLRRGVGTPSSGVQRTRTTSRRVAVPDDFNSSGEEPELIDAEELAAQGKISETAAEKGPPAKASERSAKSDKSAAAPAPKPKAEKKSTKPRVILLFLLLLVIVLALLITPVAYPGRVSQLDALRQNERAKPIYDWVESAYKPIRELLGLPDPNPPAVPDVPLPPPSGPMQPEGEGAQPTDPEENAQE